MKALFSVIASLGIIAGCGWLSFRLGIANNDFPVSYHPDEYGKANQVMPDRRELNFHHPLLLLRAGALAVDWLKTPDQDQREVTIAGRYGSAALVAWGVMALTAATAAARGPAAAVIVGLVMAQCPQMVAYAHYMKEESALIAGLASAVLGARLFLIARAGWTQALASILLGAGCGLAASGKYVGAAALAPALLAVILAPRPRAWWFMPLRFVLMPAAAIAMFLWVNAPAFVSFWPLEISRRAMEGLNGEVEHGVTGHSDIGLVTPNTFCLRTAIVEMTPNLWFFLAVGTVLLFARRKMSVWGIVLTLFLATFIGALSYDAIPFARYAMPITLLGFFAAGDVAAAAVSVVSRRLVWRAVAWVACVGAILYCQLWRARSIAAQFGDDSRQRLREWVATHLRGQIALADGYANLYTSGDPWRYPSTPRVPATVRSEYFASDAGGSVADLARRGIQFVIVAEPTYDRFITPDVREIDGDDRALAFRRKFYTDVFNHGIPVWTSIPNPPSHTYVNPDLRVYYIGHLGDLP